MDAREKMLGEYLSRIADEINITPTMQKKAVESYEAVGKWIGEGIPLDVKIMPQGSMNLGTVIKPIDDSDDYDVDLVCLLKNGQYLELSQIKNLVGDRLKDHKVYCKMLEDEGKRCWTMKYDEFHMDILPCVPYRGLFTETAHTDIKLTHKNDEGKYEPRYSNPYAYHAWFENRMKDILLEKRTEFAARNQVEISKVPTYRVRTPLQKTIQLLKRHRDMCFYGHEDDAPISIIITTLAAHAYQGEMDVYSALCNILKRMPDYIETENKKYRIQNPVMPRENFADKWNSDPGKSEAFYQWLGRAQRELITNPLQFVGIDRIAENYKAALGKAPVERAIRASAEEKRWARENGNLYADGLGGGLTLSSGGQNRPVKEHTFFGE